MENLNSRLPPVKAEDAPTYATVADRSRGFTLIAHKSLALTKTISRSHSLER